MFTNVKVKTEPVEGDKAKKAGQGQFKPKIPPKKKPAIEQTDNISAPSTAIGESSKKLDKVTSQGSSSSSSPRRTDFNRNPQEFKGQNRQKWVMPIGQSFFMSQKISITNKKSKSNTTNSGNNNPKQSLLGPSSGLAGNGNNPMIQQSTAFSGYPLGTRRIIDDYDNNNMNVMNMGSYSFGVYNHDDELFDTDTGSDSSDSDDDREEKTDINEIWPPQKYDMLEPLSLPLGPITANKRDELERQAIIYHPDDAEALEREKSDLFLLQLPSDLCLKSNITNDEVSDDNKDDESKLDIPDDNNLKEAKKVEGKIGPCKLGKLQLTRSGKVFLVTENGKRFEVHNGITACFANFVAGIELNDNYNMDDDNNINNGDDKRKKSKTYFNDKKGNNDAPSGDLNILGRITKKLVITPDYYCS